MYRIIPKVDGYKRKEIVAFYKLKLSTDINWCRRALKRLVENQTCEEIAKNLSLENNNLGFTKYDAPKLTRLLRFNNSDNLTISNFGNILVKYAVQLIAVSDINKLKKCLDNYYGMQKY